MEYDCYTHSVPSLGGDFAGCLCFKTVEFAEKLTKMGKIIWFTLYIFLTPLFNYKSCLVKWKRILADIPSKSIRSEDMQVISDCCVICIENFQVSDVIRMLPCR